MKTETFQDPSVLMKRAMFRFVAIGVVAALLYLFCVEPCQTSLRKARAENESLKGQQTGMSRDLKGAVKVKSRLEALQAERQVYLNGLLEPLLESYAMRAKSLLDPLAADVGLTIVDYAEQPVRALPLPKQTPIQLFARRPIRVVCRGSYAEIASFLLRVEKLLPYVSLQALQIKAQKDPEAQAAEIVLEWPAKGEQSVPTPPSGGGAKK